MRTIDANILEIIRKHFPEIEEKNIIVTEGNDHNVYIVNDQVVFRFPKIPRDIDPKKSKFLQELAPLSPLPLPMITRHKDPTTGVAYEMNTYIPGISFYPKIAQSFSNEEKMNIAKQLGKFLSAIHSFSVARAQALSIDEQNPYDFWEYMEQNPNAFPRIKKIVYPYITKEEQDWIESIFSGYIARAKKNPLPRKVIHGDMWTYHIIVNPQNHILTGVIDFWGRIADPANDFKAFEYYGRDFVQQVYRNYTLPIDEEFDQRRLFYTAHDEVFELAHFLEVGDQEQIEKRKKSLSTYIHSHK